MRAPPAPHPRPTRAAPRYARSMELDRLFAGRTGSHPLPDGEPAEFVVHDLGQLRVPSGRLAIADTSNLGSPVVVPVPPGDYRVELTNANVDEFFDVRQTREAFVSLVLLEAAPAVVEPAVVEQATIQWRDEGAGGVAGIAGLHGVQMSQVSCLALSDAKALESAISGDPRSFYDTHLDPPDGGWFNMMDAPEARPRGTVNTELPDAAAGENIVLVIARELRYPIIATRDGEGRLAGVHVDMLVVGELSEALGAFEGQSKFAQYELEDAMKLEVLAEEEAEEAARRERGLRGWLRRVLG